MHGIEFRTMTWIEAGVLFVLGLSAIDGLLLAVLARTEEPLSDTAHGLPMGTDLPVFTAHATDGSVITERDAFGKLILFLGTRCPSCHVIARELQQAQGDRPTLLTVVADRGADTGGSDLLADLAFLPASQLVHDHTRAVTERLAMPGIPFVYAIDSGGRVRAKRAVVSIETLRAAARATGLQR
jgi:hypothetical protein